METISNPQHVKLIQTQHPEKIMPFARNLSDHVLGAIYGLDVSSYQTIKQQLTEQARSIAQQMLQDKIFADRIDHLPFQTGDTIVGIGESTTDDLLSWFEILRHVLELQRPQEGIRMINEGVSGYTSTQVLGKFSNIIAKQPNWILCMIGGNDTLRVGTDSCKTQVSLAETVQNLVEVRRLAGTHTTSKWIWLTPPTVDEQKVAKFHYFEQAQLSWQNADLLAIGNAINQFADPIVDVQSVFGLQPPSNYLGIDGVHPTVEGHIAIVTQFVEELTGGAER
ncbi:GDSL-type esterase/lipase family protein [Paenibacillus sp. N1-5-1-14]|uniref:GDSL-type esterase/lipase family protein n=1 Tax=Paenibacillus radicibacter TaxID=2972488 RepID=UPI002158F781|nr:GDSL-type esterase/lipase family protein [Paenibacillus radicibacter]MCR8644259.1 GDSL-type esterase/lipase family protein [Paenibacillus radicibacter]